MLTTILVGALFVALGLGLRAVMGETDERRTVPLIDDIHSRIAHQLEIIQAMEEAANRDHVVKSALQQEAVDYAGKVVDMQNDVRALAAIVKALRHERNMWETECMMWRAAAEMA